MRVVILKNRDEVDQRAADLICETVRANPQAVLGLATGGTPLGTYRELTRRYAAGEISFLNCTTFNLDEYVGLPLEHPESYHAFMHRNLFSKADFDPQRCHLPNGLSPNVLQSGDSYERSIAEAGGIDLQLLGIGSDGHIGFNEPGSSLASRTRIKALTQQTREDNARFFATLDEVPQIAITMGIGSILDARRIVLLAVGKGKAAAVRDAVEGGISSQVPASALQLHANVTILLDHDSAEQLARKAYYVYAEELERHWRDRCQLDNK